MHAFRVFVPALILVLSISVPTPGVAAQRSYQVETSIPEGRAVCSFTATVDNANGLTAVLRMAPANGEAQVLLHSPEGAPVEFVSAGFQDGCDIFPDQPVRRSFRIVGNQSRFVGLVPIHAHPGADCGSPTTAKGKVVLNLRGAQADQIARLSPIVCDGDVAHGNLLPAIDLPLRGVRATRLKAIILLQNLGPGAAHAVTFRSLLTEQWLLANYTQRNRCRFIPTPASARQNSATEADTTQLACAFDDLHPDQLVALELELVPRTTGLLDLEFIAGSENPGGVAPSRLVRGVRVGKGSSAILSVASRSRRGGAGTVNIDPAPSTGTSLNCSAPDPNNPATRDTQCIEFYDAPTRVTLTATSTIGQFSGWTGDCSGNAPTCVLDMDPNATNPDKSASAKFVK